MIRSLSRFSGKIFNLSKQTRKQHIKKHIPKLRESIANYAGIGRRMGIDPRTVKKYANQEEFKRKEKSLVMDPVKPIIDKWIKEDLKKKEVSENS